MQSAHGTNGRGTSQRLPLHSSRNERPQAITYRIEDLLELVRDGRIRVPEFQRPWQWDADDVAALFDSVYHGYPVGSLLLWKRPADAATLRLGPHSFTVPARDDAFSVVDGHQRITALAGVLLSHPRQDGASEFDLYFDLAAQTFVRRSNKRPPAAHWLPLDVVLDAEDLFAWLDEYRRQDPPQDHARLAVRLGKLIREYEIPAYLVDSDDERVIRDIFYRINLAGKPLTVADVFDGLHSVTGRAEPGSLREVAARLESAGFGVFDTDLLLRTLVALVGPDVMADPGEMLRHEIDTGEALSRTERALRRTIAFLQEDARIPHLRLLPYTMTVVALAAFLDRYPEPLPRNRILLARWIWRGASTGMHRGDKKSLRSAISSIDGRGESATVKALLDTLPKKPASAWRLESYDSRHARSMLETLALLDLGPRHLSTGASISVADLFGDAERGGGLPILVRAREEVSEAVRMLGRTVANRLAHPALGAGQPQEKLFDGVSEDVLATHAVTPAGARRLANGDVLGFLKERSGRLRTHIHAFLESRAAWSQNDRPPLKSLVIEDD